MSPRPVSLQTPDIPVAEFAQRREKVNKALKNRIGMIFAGQSDAALQAPTDRIHTLSTSLESLMSLVRFFYWIPPRPPIAKRRSS